MPEELWTEVHDNVQEAVIKTIPKKKMEKAKWLLQKGISNSCEKKRNERQRRKRKIYPFECFEFQRIARRDKKAFLSDQCKEIEENNRIGKARDLLKKIRVPREHFMHRWAQ